jgi:hypothetical protein
MLGQEVVAMSIKNEIEALKSKALQRIGEAAKTGDTRVIIGATRIVQEAERLIKGFEELVSELGGLAMDFKGLEHGKDVDISIPSGIKMSARMRGRLMKEAFINDLKAQGIPLNLSKDSILLTEKGERVGVAYSSEHSPGRWWLGIKNDNYRAIVLICEKDTRGIVRLVIPGKFWDSHVENLKENKNGRSMIHILYQRGVYYWVDRSGEKITLNNFVDAYQFIR